MMDRVYPERAARSASAVVFFCQCSELTEEVTDEAGQVRRGAVEVTSSLCSIGFWLSGILCVLQFCFHREGEEVR
jgi:hypothetical protein